ncbi:MAG: hypothetical protein SFV22_09380 [Saprospiraceae bacterium]|nr:hypothetical protein [Saprospiraceae bacterium]
MENINQPLQEQIHALVNGELDEAAANQLRHQAKTDTALAEELAFSQSLALALKQPELRTAHAVLKNVMAEEGFPPPSTGKTYGWKTWLGIASLALLLGSVAYFTVRETGFLLSETQELSRSRLMALENVLFFSNGGQNEAALRDGMRLYDAGKYKQAAKHLQTYLNARPDDAARVYLGVARLMDHQPEKAVQALQIAANSPEPPIREAALWYLALAYLEAGNADKADATLRLLPPDGLYGPQATELRQNLKQ